MLNNAADNNNLKFPMARKNFNEERIDVLLENENSLLHSEMDAPPPIIASCAAGELARTRTYNITQVTPRDLIVDDPLYYYPMHF